MGTVLIEFCSSSCTLGLEDRAEEVILEADVGDGNTVCTLLSRLAAEYPRFGRIVFDGRSKRLNEEMNLFLNGRPLELLSGLETKLSDGDVLSLVPHISGG